MILSCVGPYIIALLKNIWSHEMSSKGSHLALGEGMDDKVHLINVAATHIIGPSLSCPLSRLIPACMHSLFACGLQAPCFVFENWKNWNQTLNMHSRITAFSACIVLKGPYMFVLAYILVIH